VKAITASLDLDAVGVLGEKTLVIISLTFERIKLTVDLSGMEVNHIAFAPFLNQIACFGMDSCLLDLSSGQKSSRLSYGSPALPIESVFVDPNRIDVVYVCQEDHVFQFDFKSDRVKYIRDFTLENFERALNVTASTFGSADLLAVNIGKSIVIYNSLNGSKAGEIPKREYKFARVTSFGDTIMASLSHPFLASGPVLEFYQFSSPHAFLGQTDADRPTGTLIKGSLVNIEVPYFRPFEILARRALFPDCRAFI
jgi:hypothetical protein